MVDQLHFFKRLLHEVLGNEPRITSIHAASGGMINHTYIIRTNNSSFFVKWNDDPSSSDLFEKEADGLAALVQGKIKVPSVLGYGIIEDRYYLVLEHISKSNPVPHFWEDFGNKLADLHQCGADRFGWHIDNHIGKLHQENSWYDEWVDFFIDCRLEPQIKLAVDHRLLSTKTIVQFENLYPKLVSIFPPEKPALIHGDLWSGNFMIGEDGCAVVYDPAVYYGHREIELAFTRLFGGFDDRFYQAYNCSYKLSPGFEEREEIYNLYPLLVHVNLFGSSYLSGILRTLDRFS